jgi:hypothetical protein
MGAQGKGEVEIDGMEEIKDLVFERQMKTMPLSLQSPTIS